MIRTVGKALPYKVHYRVPGELASPERYDNERIVFAWCASEIGQRAVTAEVFLLGTYDWNLIDLGGQWYLAGVESWYFRRHADAMAFVLKWK